MKLFFFSLLLFLSTPLSAKVESGKLSPDFTLGNEMGEKIKLADQRGKLVVLEWYNKDCPFVKKHYDSNNMQNLQKKWTNKGVAWFTIISSAKGKQGHLTEGEAALNKVASGSLATSILLDPSGNVGQMYGAKTTPHMYVLDQKGILIYQGAIDDSPGWEVEEIKTAKNHVDDVLGKLINGEKVKPASTQAYGCAVKY